MSLFGSIVDKIVSYAETAVGGGPAKAAEAPHAPDATPAAQPEAPAATAAGSSPASASPTPANGSSTPLQAVDIGAVLTARAAASGETLHWQTSIVDLLKTLDLDSSLDARKQLAGELGVHAGADGSAEENIALHKAVVAALEANGGNVPAAMKA